MIKAFYYHHQEAKNILYVPGKKSIWIVFVPGPDWFNKWEVTKQLLFKVWGEKRWTSCHLGVYNLLWKDLQCEVFSIEIFKNFCSIRKWRTWNRKNELLKYPAWLPPAPPYPLALGKGEMSLICLPLIPLVAVALDCCCLWQFQGYFNEMHKKHQKRSYETEGAHPVIRVLKIIHCLVLLLKLLCLKLLMLLQ